MHHWSPSPPSAAQVDPYESTLLDIVTVTSAGILLIRIMLGYQRMADRFRSYVNEMLQVRDGESQRGGGGMQCIRGGESREGMHCIGG